MWNSNRYGGLEGLHLYNSFFFHQVRNVIEINILSDLERTRFLPFDTHPNHKASGASFINLLDFLGRCQFAFLIFGPYVIILHHNFSSPRSRL